MVQFLGFGTLLLVPRFVTPAELGDIKILQSYTALFLVLSGFGLNTAILKLCAEKRPEDEKQYFLKAALQRSLLATAGAYLLLTALAFSGVLASSQRLAIWMVIYALVLPFNMMTILFATYLQARMRIREMARAQLIVKAQAVLVIIGATWLFGFEGFVFSTIFGFAIGLIPFLRQIGTAFLRVAKRPLPALFMSMAVYSVLADGINILGTHGDIYILSLFHTDEAEIGYYALATYFLLGANIVTSTLQMLTLPTLSEHADDEAWFKKTLVRLQIQTVGLSVLVAVGVHAAAWVLIRFFYDPVYLVALRYLDVLLIKYVLWSSFAIMGTAVVSLGLPKYSFYGTLITTPIGLGLAYYFLQEMGIIGVAWAQVAANAVAFFVLLTITWRALRHYYGNRPHASGTG